MTDHGPGGRDGVVTVTHPTHPFRGRRLNVRARRGRGPTEILVCDGPDGGRVSVLRSWTEWPAAEPVADCGRAHRARRPEAGGPAFQVSTAALLRLRTSVEETVGLLAGIEAPADRYSAEA
ncbi:DUF5372 family protein [Streptomyces sp. NPDC056883]|uniref:DUF5372 family protein n=1 Tax=Streptomyces sp. NPDC056883 TaxID=3345959 RepID=UPI003696888B